MTGRQNIIRSYSHPVKNMNNITQLLQNIPKFNHASHSIFNFRIVNSILKYLKVEAFRALLTIIAGIAKLGHLT